MTPKKYPELKNLKYLRKKNKKTIKDMSEYLNISKSMYSYIENGDKILSYDNASKLATYFNKSPDELFYEDYCEYYKNEII